MIFSLLGPHVTTIKEVMSISSGTLARLFGTSDYAEIDQHLDRWVAWLAKGGKAYPTWQHAWVAYREDQPCS